ncbi:HNH endonuclease [Salmonella enterica subsp. enterica serovar Kentucky]|nr:HNH endonuclease [Salmonella enterica subsp. enterica serovar Kentucky]
MKCKIDGCDRECRYMEQQVCQKHYFRMMRYGTYELTKHGKGKGISANAKGYVMIKEPSHPLAMKNGFVYEHRKAVYAKFGEHLPPCELCGKYVTWANAHIDHKDDRVNNNNPDNLRVLCNACNVMRSRIHIPSHTRKNSHAITFNGETKTPAEWSRDPRVSIAGNTILFRLRKGMSVEQALFGQKLTHRGKKANGYQPKYGEYQQKLKDLRDSRREAA